MFTGITETTGIVRSVTPDRGNLHVVIATPLSAELKIDQSVSHNGVCLTVVDVASDAYRVTAIEETLNKSNLRRLRPGDAVNLERCLKLGDRLDGHIVQGHVDEVARCVQIAETNGSWIFGFEYEAASNQVTVSKGSICVNGVSLTVVDSGDHNFSVAIIPYTFDHTNFNRLKVGDEVNIEFDVVGKYIARLIRK